MYEPHWIVPERGSAALLDGFLQYESLSRSGSRFELRLSRRETAGRRGLSEDERGAIQMLLLGRSQKEIAFELGVSVATVSTLIRVALRRLGIPCWQHVVLAAAFLERAAMNDHRPSIPGCEMSVEEAACVVHVELSSALLSLTDAERDVVLAAADGCSNEQIACGSNKSVRTVANQLASAFRKMGARGRVELLRCIAQQMCAAP